MEKTVLDRVSDLAQLSLDPEEKESFGRDVELMLSYVNRMNELNTEGVEPLCQVTLKEDANVFREDEVIAGEDGETYLREAPARRGDYFVVPKSFS